jgi:copper homeostasis protein
MRGNVGPVFGVACFLSGAILGVVTVKYFSLEKKSRKRDFRDSSQPMKKRESLKLQQSHTVEICVSDISSAIAAIHGGATSLELCSNRLEGGVTPSIGFVEECVRVCRNLSVEVHVLVRPRPGGFVYSPEEFEVIIRDISSFVAVGVDGIVCGVLSSDNKVDEVRMKAIRQTAKNVKLTFHRAFDLCLSKDEAICSIIKLGCDRLLTSGQERSAIAGAEKLRILQQKYGEYIRIIAAAGIKIDNVKRFIRESQVMGIHTGSGVDIDNVETHHYIDPEVFTDMMRWRGANIDLVEQFVNKCMKGWGGDKITNDESLYQGG